MNSKLTESQHTQNKCAIITGASSGVGQATAELLAQKDYDLVLAYASNDAGADHSRKLCEQQGARVKLVKGDIAEEQTCQRIVDTALDHFARIDVLVNNAATTRFCHHRDLDALSPEDFQRIYAVNAVAPYMMVSKVRETMKAQGKGVIVNVASTAGLNGIGSSIAYCASKAALLNMTKSMARVLGPEIRINAVCPGFIQGEWLRQGLGETAYDKIKAATETAAPLKATTTPEDIAEAIAMLIQGPALMTGDYIVVDAGKLLG